jgi:hypothetical protein
LQREGAAGERWVGEDIGRYGKEERATHHAAPDMNLLQPIWREPKETARKTRAYLAVKILDIIRLNR